jgi:NAD(P)-dependent dehydrogenase (short-subunit alcohol dehydrogenase family)
MPSAGCVLVTGANRGLGLEFVRQYAADGAQVVATCRTPDEADDLRAVPGDVEVLRLDVTDDDDVEAVATHLAGRPIDLLLCNAAILGGPRSRVDDLNWKGWQRAFDVNVLGVARVATGLRANVAAASGTIIVVASRAGLTRESKKGQTYIYRSTKAAANTVGRMLALDLADDGILVAMVNPGHARTGIGGKNAPLSAAESVGMMRTVIVGMGPEHAGGFWHLDGTELPI